MTIVRSTIANNAGHGSLKPGGILNRGELTVMYSTIAGNVGLGDPGGIDDASGAPATITATVIAANVTTNGDRWDCAGPVTSNGYNLLGGTDQPSSYPSHPCAYSADATDQRRADADQPAALPLGGHGGSTKTMPPRDTSPAIDVIPIGALAADGTTPVCPSFGTKDQRGVPRPQGSGCDVGSVERKPKE
jgi:hypothetical protein